MAPLNEIVSRLLESTPKATVDDTLQLLGLSMPAIPADPSATESRKQALEKKLDHLVRQFLVLTQHKSNIKEAAGELETEARRVQDELSESERPGVSPDALIRFVNVLEEANQYFDFQISAKQAYAHHFKHVRSPKQISHTLLLDKNLCSDFPKLGKAQITNAAHAIFWELYNQLHRKNKTNKEEDPALFDWIYNLAFQARKHGYAVDEDPIVELEKIMKTEPYVYDNYFLSRRLQVEYTDRRTGRVHGAGRRHGSLYLLEFLHLAPSSGAVVMFTPSMLKYPAPGAPDLAKKVKALLQKSGFGNVKEDKARGLDHGAWVPLMLMYPEANIPVCQLSLQSGRDGTHHYNMGKALAPLRDEDVLIIGSGSATHNLRALGPDGGPAPKWALDFDTWLKESILNGRHDELNHFEEKAPSAKMAHPWPEHFFPLHVALGAVGEKAKAELIHHSWGNVALSYASYRFSTAQ